MKLTDKTIIHLTKPGRYSDGAVQGLHLWVKSPAKKYWILKMENNKVYSNYCKSMSSLFSKYLLNKYLANQKLKLVSK